MRDRIGTHGASEYQKDGGKDGRLDHRQGDPGHDLPLRGIQNRRRFLQVRIHVAENAADQDVCEGGVVKTQDHQAREQAFAPPDRHRDAGQRGQETVGGAGDRVTVEEVLPHDGQGPLRHDVGEDEDGTQILLELQVRAGDQECHDAAEDDGHDAGAHSQPDGVQQRRPQVGPGKFRGKQVSVVYNGIA